MSSFLSSVVFPSSVFAANLTLTIPSSALIVKATPNQFSKSDAQKISVSTDSVGGYTLKLSSKNGNTLNNTSNGGASKINPITSELTEAEFSALGSGGSSGGGGSSNMNVWGFKPSKLNGSDNSSSESGKFIAAPDSNPITLDTTSVANSDAANEYDITLGVKVDSTLPAGSYSNTFVLTATVNALKYDITYDAGNANDEVTNMPSPIKDTGETSSTTIPLTNTIPEWSGYVFQGWCTVKPVMKSGRDNCETIGGTKYASGADFPLTMASTTTTLYAMWNELLLTDVFQATTTETTFKVGDGIEMIMVADNQTRTFEPPVVQTATTTKWWPYYAIENTPVTMKIELPTTPADVKYLVTVVPKKNYKFTYWQKNEAGTEWTAVGEAATTTTAYKPMSELTQDECQAAGESGMNVTDTRNNVSYTVGQFAERCWMYGNLRLEGGTPLTPDDSDVNGATSVATAVTADQWQDWFSKKEMIECKGALGQNVTPFEFEPTKDQNRTCADNTTTITEFYYNWFAAIANDAVGDPPTDAGSYEEGSTGHASLDSQAKGSICPKNWRLMEEDTAGDGVLITEHYEIEAFVNAQKANQEDWPGRLVTSGIFRMSQQHRAGLYGTWWSASRVGDARGYRLDLGYHEGAYVYNSADKLIGSSIRCILRDGQ